ncbi:MAG: LPS export ABC transporter periplasmic protein LptC [Pseudomonadota bacterium]
MVLVLGALALWWALREAPREPAASEFREQLLGEPDLALNEARIRQFRDSGRLSYELLASSIRHFEYDAITRLVTPDLTMYGENTLPWRTTAGQGFIRKEIGPDNVPEDMVFLRSRVVLRQRQDDGRFMTLKTPHLYVYPDRQYAQTDQSVTIDTDVGQTSAVGMAADLARGRIRLSSSAQERVTTVVERDQFK